MKNAHLPVAQLGFVYRFTRIASMEREMLCFLYDFSCLRPVNKDSKASGAKTKEGVSTFFFAEHQSQSSALSSGRDLTATTLSGVMNVVL